jgi:hypothetical protein
MTATTTDRHAARAAAELARRRAELAAALRQDAPADPVELMDRLLAVQASEALLERLEARGASVSRSPR